MQRRNFLKGLFVVGMCPICAQVAKADGSHWGYEGEGGPSHWGDLSKDNSACSAGAQQSPIDITSAIKADLPETSLDWKPAKGAVVVNNGHTMQVNMPKGNLLKRGGATYEMLQFHFHAPSEHLVEGKSFPMEVHFVHKNTETGALGVLGVFIKDGGSNQAFETLAGEFPEEAGKEVADDAIDPRKFLPSKLDYWAYEGSLTTPPCSEVVDWMVVHEPIEVAAADIEKFTKLYKMNARPTAKANRRYVLSST